MNASRRCSLAEAARTNVACAARAGVEAGISKRRGANNDDRACGVRPERCEWAAKRDKSLNNGVRTWWYRSEGTSPDRYGNASAG
jgi:hypothetical protein